MGKIAALFDVDGTIYRDSLLTALQELMKDKPLMKVE